MILPFKKNYFNFKTATTKPDGGEGCVVLGEGGGGRKSLILYKRACYLLTGTQPLYAYKCVSV